MRIFIKLMCEALTDSRLIAAGPEAFAVWVRGLLYAKQHLTDGEIPAGAMPLVSIGCSNPEAAIQKLLDTGLWVASEGGYTVGKEKWARYQLTKEEVEEKQAKITKRVRDWRLRKRNENVTPLQPDVKRSCNADVTLPTETETETETENKERNIPKKEGSKPANGQPKARREYHPIFEEWYSHYPYKSQKEDAAKAYEQVVKRLKESLRGDGFDPHAFLLERVKVFAVSDKGRGEFCPLPATWLRKGCYDDEESTWRERSNGRAQNRPNIGAGSRYDPRAQPSGGWE